MMSSFDMIALMCWCTLCVCAHVCMYVRCACTVCMTCVYNVCVCVMCGRNVCMCVC